MGQCYSKNAVALMLSQAAEQTAEITMRTQAAENHFKLFEHHLNHLRIHFHNYSDSALCNTSLENATTELGAFTAQMEMVFMLRTFHIQLLPKDCSTRENKKIVQEKVTFKARQDASKKTLQGFKVSIETMCFRENLSINRNRRL